MVSVQCRVDDGDVEAGVDAVEVVVRRAQRGDAGVRGLQPFGEGGRRVGGGGQGDVVSPRRVRGDPAAARAHGDGGGGEASPVARSGPRARRRARACPLASDGGGRRWSSGSAAPDERRRAAAAPRRPARATTAERRPAPGRRTPRRAGQRRARPTTSSRPRTARRRRRVPGDRREQPARRRVTEPIRIGLVGGAELPDRPLLHRRGRQVDDRRADGEDGRGCGVEQRGDQVGRGDADQGRQDVRTRRRADVCAGRGQESAWAASGWHGGRMTGMESRHGTTRHDAHDRRPAELVHYAVCRRGRDDHPRLARPTATRSAPAGHRALRAPATRRARTTT